MRLTKWKVAFELPRCCRCGNDALVCLMAEAHDKKAVKENRAAVRRWRARTKAAQEMLRGAVDVKEI